jgi:8-oxo-dGTP diphosphatase
MKGRRAPRPGEGPVRVAAGIVIEDGRVLVAQRPLLQSFPLQWEFPGGKVEPGETPEAALVREFEEELGVTVRPGERYAEIRYVGVAGREIHVEFFRAARVRGEPRPLQVADVRWVEGDALDEVDFIPANRPVVSRLRKELRGQG